MRTVNFATDLLISYLNSERYDEALVSFDEQQSLVGLRSCKIRKSEKLCDDILGNY